jgi:hypothetical protein
MAVGMIIGLSSAAEPTLIVMRAVHIHLQSAESVKKAE